MPVLYFHGEHLYIFEASFYPSKDLPEAEGTTFSELTFEFRIHDETYQVKGCGVQFLEANNESAGNTEGNNETEGEESRRHEDEETRNKK